VAECASEVIDEPLGRGPTVRERLGVGEDRVSDAVDLGSVSQQSGLEAVRALKANDRSRSSLGEHVLKRVARAQTLDDLLHERPEVLPALGEWTILDRLDLTGPVAGSERVPSRSSFAFLAPRPGRSPRVPLVRRDLSLAGWPA
jgi:hypothetical protein